MNSGSNPEEMEEAALARVEAKGLVAERARARRYEFSKQVQKTC